MFERAKRLLSEDVMQHIVSLKVLDMYRDSVVNLLEEDGRRWAIISIVPTANTFWDRALYPHTDYVFYVDSNCGWIPETMLSRLPTHARFLLKSPDRALDVACGNRFSLEPRKTFLSFCTEEHAGFEADSRVELSDAISEELVAFFGQNDYAPQELAEYFDPARRRDQSPRGRHAAGRGEPAGDTTGGPEPQTFVLRESGTIACACFVYPNYGTVWEVAGLRTNEEYRGRGFARAVTMTALAYLAESGAIARYQVLSTNEHSIRIARRLGLRQFLEIRHFESVPA